MDRNRTGTWPPVERSWPGPLAPAGRRHGRGHHVLDAVAGAGPAVVAGGPPAVGQAVLGQGVLPVLPQEVAVEAGREVVPGQHLVLGAVAVDGVLEGHPVGGEGVGPQVEVEVLGPLLEGAAVAPHLLDDRAHAPVAPADDALGGRGLRVVPADGQAPHRPGGVAEQVDLAGQLLDGVLAEPLERRLHLGDEAADRGGDGDRRCGSACRWPRTAWPGRRCRGCPRRSRWAGRSGSRA